MSLFIEEEGGSALPFDVEETARSVVEAALELEECPYEAEVSLLLTTDEEIHKMNLEFRQIDRATDVLSFPMLEYETPGDLSGIDEERYGHSPKREYAFLIAHSMLHLFGYDHMEEEERRIMEERQRRIMEKVQIPR